MADSTSECEAQSSGNQFTSDTSVLELLTRQQTRGEKGIRLVFHNTLAQTVSLEKDPYFFCALTGNTSLAVFLYQHNIPKGHPLRIATFTSDGTSGVTPWRKAIKVTAAIAARLAGHASTAEALDNIERGTPLLWCNSNAHLWPENLKNKVKPTVEACAQSAWFVSLPGTVRMRIMEKLINQLASQTYWSRLPNAALHQDWSQAIDAELLQAAMELFKAPQRGSSSVSKRSTDDQDPQFPSYQIRITGEQVPQTSRARAAINHLTRGAAGCLAVKALRHLGFGRIVPEGIAVFAIGCVFPAPTILLAALLIRS